MNKTCRAARVACVLLAMLLLFASCNMTENEDISEKTDSGSVEQTVDDTQKPQETPQTPARYTAPEPPVLEGDVADTLKVMTYNLQGGKPDGKSLTVRSSDHAEKINLVDPDVVLLCEARHFSRKDHDLDVSILTAKCDIPYGILQSPEKRSTNVILYNEEKLECVSFEAIPLADGGDEYERSAAIALLKHKESGVCIVAVSVHLDLNTFASEEQAKELLTHLNENYSEYGTQIIAGDFNRESFAITYMGGLDAVHEYALTDGGFYSANQGLDRTYTHKSSILDYIYFKGAYPTAYKVITESVGDEPSDHYPVYAELQIYKNNGA